MVCVHTGVSGVQKLVVGSEDFIYLLSAYFAHDHVVSGGTLFDQGRNPGVLNFGFCRVVRPEGSKMGLVERIGAKWGLVELIFYFYLFIYLFFYKIVLSGLILGPNLGL